jgi:hypothetical protein
MANQDDPYLNVLNYHDQQLALSACCYAGMVACGACPWHKRSVPRPENTTNEEKLLANDISDAISRHFGYVVLHVRYDVAYAAIRELRKKLDELNDVKSNESGNSGTEKTIGPGSSDGTGSQEQSREDESS